ncbi:hypothetical protein GG344DRAFT_83373 [Lentinula edodes]|nr:hypothetical protein GG344DRAFT_83373 [Lentinula edodes]
MSFPSSSAVTGAPNPVLPPVSPPSHPNSAEMTVDAAINELASTLEEPPLGQLALFRSVFGVSVSLASSLPPPIPSVVVTPRALAKKRKRSVWQDEGGSSSLRKPPVGEVSEPEVAPEVHNCKRKRPVGESRDAEVPDYCRVVLVLRPPLVNIPGLVPLSGDRVDEVVHSPPPSEESGSTRVPLPLSQGRSSDLLGSKQSNSPEPVADKSVGQRTIKTPPPSQHSCDVPHPFPRARATAALKAENEALRAEVADLRKLLEASRTETSILTSLLRDTTTSLNNRNKDLEASRCALQDVAADCLEYGCVLAQFRAIEAELPQAPLEDTLTQFHLAVAEVDDYREVAIRQKQELSELCVC